MSSQRLALLSDEFAYVPAHELATRIRRRDLSPVEVVKAFIRRIEARNPSLNESCCYRHDSLHRVLFLKYASELSMRLTACLASLRARPL